MAHMLYMLVVKREKETCDRYLREEGAHKIKA